MMLPSSWMTWGLMFRAIRTSVAFLFLHFGVAVAEPADTDDTNMILMAYALYGGTSGAATPVQTTIIGSFKSMQACSAAARSAQFTDLSVGSPPGSAKTFMYFGI